MPGKARFGSGSLLGPVTPIPDDDDPQTPSRPSRRSLPVEPEPPASSPAPAAAHAPPAAQRTTAQAPPAESRRNPPATLRLNDIAGSALWDAFLIAKAGDPFLSYRQFASHVVLNGLGRAARGR